MWRIGPKIALRAGQTFTMLPTRHSRFERVHLFVLRWLGWTSSTRESRIVACECALHEIAYIIQLAVGEAISQS